MERVVSKINEFEYIPIKQSLEQSFKKISLPLKLSHRKLEISSTSFPFFE
jgi:hypothetical protein